MLFKVFVLCFMLKLVRNEEIKYCYTNATSPKHDQFATKTAYAEIKGTLADMKYEIAGCEPVKIWLLSRHGAIHPSNSTLDKVSELKALLELIVEPTDLCIEDLDLLKTWEWDNNKTEHPEFMSEQGWLELKTLAADYKLAFDGLFKSAENVLFRHTFEQAVNESFIGFAKELFKDEDVVEDNSDNDNLFKFYKTCPKWTENKKKLKDADSYLSIFEISAPFNDTIKGVSDRLGLGDEPLTAEIVKAIWDMCRFGRAWENDKLSPWCAAFTQEHIDVLEYHEDLKLYQKTGYGFDINSRVACKAVVNLLDHFDSTTSPYNVSVSFARATTIQLFLTALGAHKNETVKPSNDSMAGMSDRKWKSSQISPYAANLAVVKYTCTNNQHQVKFFLNQKPLEFDWCTESVCKLEDFNDAYLPFKEADCEKYFCSDTSGNAKTVYGVFAVAVNLILIYFY